jgi:hypothetical protein
MDADGPIGVIASGAGAAVLVADLRRRMPHEDVISMSDHGHPAWARLRGPFVCQRVRTMSAELAEAGAKLIVIASLQGTLDGLESARSSTPVPVMGIDLGFSVTRAAALAKGGRVAVVASAAGVRLPQLQGALKQIRSGGMEVIEPGAADFGGYRALVLADAIASAAGPRVAAAAGPELVVVDTAAVTSAQAHRFVARSAGLARRRRPGRHIQQSSHPARITSSSRGS